MTDRRLLRDARVTAVLVGAPSDRRLEQKLDAPGCADAELAEIDRLLTRSG
ncbi:hypothetical protein AB0F96_36970 [Streptomyces sp. NPDC023998]|uniref:hypothetical protein n=1 Tax=Streptomyces sp. NPDC023998 TaxID=3154597 RepID=UPI0033CFB982